MSQVSFISDLAFKIRNIFGKIDAKTRAFQAATGLACVPGCGKCCRSPDAEAYVAEMVPLAIEMIAQGKASDLYRRLEDSQDGICALYQSSPQDANKGSCSAYDFRPSLCRLFGFAAVSTKTPGIDRLSTCEIIKGQNPAAVEKAVHLMQGSDAVPHLRDFSMQIQALAPSTIYAERLPINKAIKIVLEKLTLLSEYNRYQDLTTAPDDPQSLADR